MLCLLIAAATSYPLQAQATSGSMLSSLVGDLASDLSAMAQKGLSRINSIKENYGSNAAETVEKIWQTYVVPSS